LLKLHRMTDARIIKKDRKTPKPEMALAQTRKAQYLQHHA